MSAHPLQRVGRWLSSALIALIEVTAWLLRPFRIGRLLSKVSLPRLRDNPLRTSVTALGVTIAVAAVVSVVLVDRSIVASAQSTVDDVAGKADLQVAAATGGLDESNLERALEVPGVFKVTPVLEQTVLLRESKARGERLLLLGLNLASSDDNYFRDHGGAEFDEINRDPLAFLDSASNILISQKLAERLGRKLHDKIALDTPEGAKWFEIWGLLDDKKLARAYGGQIAIMHHQSMQAAFGRGTSIDRIDVALQPEADLMKVIEGLRRAFDDRFRIEEPEQKNTRIAQMLVGLDTAMSAASVIAVLIAMFLIYNTTLISVVQRKKELGTLRAIGATARQATRLMTLEGSLIGSVASLFGVGLGVVLARVMVSGMRDSVASIYMNVGDSRLRYDPQLLIGCFVLGSVATGIAAYVAARGATRVPPIESLVAAANLTRYMGHTRISLADVVGVLLLAAVPLLTGAPRLPWLKAVQVAAPPSLLLLGAALLAPRVVQLLHAVLERTGRKLGVATMMANRNLTRDLMRSAITAGALILGLGMAVSFVVFISSFVKSANDWVEQSVPADLFITSSAPGLVTHTPLPAALIEPLQRAQGVSSVEPIRMADLAYHNNTLKLVSTDVAAYAAHAKLIMVQGEQAEAMREVSEERALMVNESFANHFGLWRGDHVVLRTETSTIELKISGVYVDYLSDRGVVLIDRKLYLKHWSDQTVDMFKVYTHPSSDLEALRRELAAQLGARYDLLVLTGREFADNLTGQIDQVFTIMRALQAVALVIAIMGVINALSANVHDRVREIGILRAVGMLQKQVQKLIVIEALLIGLCGASVGALVGIGAGRLILTSAAVAVVGWSIPLAPDWWMIGQMTLSCVLASAVAGFLPARSAARLSIPDAVAHR